MADNMTHRQLAELMASGWGEWMHNPSNTGTVYTSYKYTLLDADHPLGKNSEAPEIVVIGFGDTNWQFPTKELYARALMARRVKNLMGF